MAVSNHDMIIATNKTGHIARAYPAADRCWDAPHSAVIPGDNYIETTFLGTGKTTKTLIDGANVWTAVGLIDAAPSKPPHAGVGGGVVSTTYIKEASAKTYSKDVKFEKNGVVRTLDKTKQNHKNCDGFVDDSQVKGQVDAAADYLKKKCSVEKITGKCSHGRELAAPPNAKSDDAFFLDVVSQDEVTLIAERKDLDANAPSACKDHTYWGAERAGQGPDERLDFIGDTFVVKGGVMADPYTGQFSEMKKPAEAPDMTAEKNYNKDKEKFIKDQQKNKGSDGQWMTPPTPPGKANFTPIDAPTKADGTADRRTKESKYNEGLNSAVNQRAALAAVKNIEKAIAFWLIEREPPTVNVTALACAGAKHVRLRVFPKDGIKFDLFTEALNAKLNLIRNISKVVEYITGKFGVSFWLKFLESPNFVLEVAYKELTQDKNGYVKSQVRKSWSLSFSFAPFFEVGCKFTVPLLPAVAAIASPGVAKAVQWLMEKAGVAVNFFAEAKLALNPSISATWDEYDEKYMSGPTATLVITFSAGFEATVSGWGSAEVRGYLEGTIALEAWKFAKAPALVESDLTGSLQLGIKGFVKASKWGFEKTLYDFDWKPGALRYPGTSDWSKPSTETKKIATIQLTVK